MTIDKQNGSWIKCSDKIPELFDGCVLIHFDNGSIETVHVEDMFKDVTCGLDESGVQLYTKTYLNHDPKPTHWQPLPKPPVE